MENLNKLKINNFSCISQRTEISGQTAILKSRAEVTGDINWLDYLNGNFDQFLEAECILAWEWETLGSPSLMGDSYFFWVLLTGAPPNSHGIDSRKIFLGLWQEKKKSNHCEIWPQSSRKQWPTPPGKHISRLQTTWFQL